jgi:anti-sigma B factor antagonist
LGVAFLNVETVVHDWAVVVAPIGAIDSATVRTFDAELRRAESDGLGAIVVDLGGVEFMGSSGLTALWSAKKRARSHGWRLALAGCGSQLMRVLEITGFDRHFEIVSDPADLREAETGRQATSIERIRE